MITKLQLSKMKRWYYPHISTYEIMRMSGWKVYIFGENIDDSYDICRLLLPVMEKYNLTMKVATQHIIDRNTDKDLAWSMGVIYLHAEIFEQKKVGRMLDDINCCLRDYIKRGVVKGAKSINGKVHYRYDLREPVNPSEGVVYEKYISLYRGEGGEYNIPGNDDIESFF